MIACVELIVGLEVHVELATRSKMFSRAPNPAHESYEGATPNTLLDATVLALPGALPVMNRAAVEIAARVGLALGCRINPRAVWDRKGYAYPDLPKGYQISQYERPLAEDGEVVVYPLDARGDPDFGQPPFRIGIERAHLEEDAGKLLHEAPGGSAIDHSIVDLNRAGTPLLEIVTRPDFRSAAQVIDFARQLRELIRWLEAGRCIMERGQMRFEPNINTRLTLADGRTVETPIVEIKNLNSFRALEAAIEFEHAEQPGRFLADGLVRSPGSKTTRGWDPAGRTIIQRGKEDAHEYAYFPDPDLPAVELSREWVEGARRSLPESPLARRRRYVERLGLSAREAGALVDEPGTGRFFEACLDECGALGMEAGDAGRSAALLLLQGGARRANERGVPLERLGISARQVAGVVELVRSGEVSGGAGADALLGALLENPAANARDVARDRGLLLVRDDAALERWCDEAIAAHPQAAADVRAGKAAAIGRLVGAVMKLSAGRADAAKIREMLAQRLQP